MRIFSALPVAAFVALIMSQSATAQSVQLGGACLQITGSSGVGDVSGVEIKAGPRGVILTRFDAGVGAGNYGVTISSTTLLDTDIAVETSNTVFGQGPVGSIVRSGRVNSGTPPGDGHLINLRTSPPFPIQIFIPSGKFITFRRTAVSVTAVVTLCFIEPSR